ncbi:hypothetical protein EDD64_11377 [Effusibacillus lacus]|nr:hypothetical protein EDD64_11377 [Effusibacillus lacus]
MHPIVWSYIGIAVAVLALLAFPAWWMIANYRRRDKEKAK